jgi:selenocysteine lyase/cysteine desulfurase
LWVERAAVAGLREALGRLLGVAAGQVVLGHSITALFSSVAMASRVTESRRTVVLTDIEHPAAQRAWSGTATLRPGIDIVVVPPLPDGTVDLEALARRLDERCIAVCAAHVSRLSGIVQPVWQITELAHGVGAMSLVDGAQAVGRIPVDIAGIGSDFYLGTAQKALLGPAGVTFMAGHALHTGEWSPTRPEATLPDVAALSAFRGGLTALSQIDIPVVGADLSELLVSAFADIGLRLLHGDSSTPRAGIATFDLKEPGISGRTLGHALRAAGFASTFDEHFIRLSLHLPNDADDVKAVVRTVHRLIRQM